MNRAVGSFLIRKGGCGERLDKVGTLGPADENLLQKV